MQGTLNIRSLIFPIAIGTVGLFTMAFIGHSLQAGQLSLLPVSKFKLVNFTFTMQLYILPLSFMGLLYLYFYNKNAFQSFFYFHLNSEKKLSTNWTILGPTVLIGFAIITSFYMSFNVLANKGTINQTFWKLLPLVLLFSFTNAWTEEILGRFVIVGGLFGKLPPLSICSISAAVFGIPHFFSGGVLSVLVSSLLGWLLAKSVVETQSLGWALLIHFLLDIIVFGSGAMIVAGSV